MLSLAYRIATMSPHVDSGALVGKDRNEVFAAVKKQQKEIGSAIKIKADNVARFLAYHHNQCSLFQIPNLAPPFEVLFVEFNLVAASPGKDGKMVENHDGWSQMGALIKSRLLAEPEAKKIKDDMGLEPKWGLSFDFWLADDMQPHAGMPICWGRQVGSLLDSNGKPIHFFGPDDPGSKHHWTKWAVAVAGFAVSFMHCRNVRQVEAKIDPGERFRKQYKVPKYTYRTLQIDPMKEVLRHEGKSDTDGLQRALHICRGHFSTYSDEKPLFGKYPGTFWVPDHVRGTKERGEVVKDYAVKTGELNAATS